MTDEHQKTRLLQRGIDAARGGRREEARRMLIRVTALDERCEPAWLWLSSVVDSLQQRRICLENVLTINPHNENARAGLRWLDEQVEPSADEACPRCGRDVSPSDEQCLACGLDLVVVCPTCGDYAEVEQRTCPACGDELGDYREGIGYLISLGRRYVRHQRYDLVGRVARRIEEEAPDDPGALEAVGGMHESLGHTDRAAAVYRRAIERSPEEATFYARLGAIYRRRVMPDEAREMYQQAARRAEDNPQILFELVSLIVEEDGVNAGAREMLERVVELDPDHAPAQVLLGDVLLALKQGQQAIEHYEQARALTQPDSPLGRKVRRLLSRLRPEIPKDVTHGWAQVVRLTAGLMISPLLAAWVNAQLDLLAISAAAWWALGAATLGAFAWVSASDAPRNPLMRALLGEKGLDDRLLRAVLGIPGALVWALAFGAVLAKV